ncbi:MAG: glycosyl transferase family protein [Novosphingobium sp.]|nr:glycosyl transferase family protein [Novosphingobium sp.]MCB2077214.1 glycosyl transferase family protein [Novosphingobium sp.]
MVELSQLLDVLQRAEHELLLFAAFWFVVGAIDELAVDCGWLWLRLTGRASEARLPKGYEHRPLDGRVAVLVPAWHEADVIAEMISHTLKAWPQQRLALYVGCYCNDPETLAAAMAGAGDDPRVRLVVHDRKGPTTKADCLNRLYRALIDDERRRGISYTSVVLHDSEDMVHPAALPVIDRVLAEVDFVQLPVRPEPQSGSRWIAGHYSDEFTEAHAKSLVVRDVLGAAIPAAGVGCGFARAALDTLASARSANGEDGPFSSECLTEDYELGLLVSRGGATGRFVRVRDSAGELVATRAFFPATLDEAVRQKARWIHGISLQGWDRLGWAGRPVDIWMALRDRRGPLIAVVLAVAYSLLVVEAIMATARLTGWRETVAVSPVLGVMLAITFASFLWRAAWRFGFTAYEYGIVEGLHSIGRIPIANIIAIMAGRRALVAYVRTLRGADVSWDKTAHRSHPASFASKAVAR